MIEDNSVQATLLMPLWGRANYSEQNPDILKDPKAMELLKRMGEDYGVEFSQFKQYHGEKAEYFGLVFCARARNLDDALEDYISRYPECSVVNLGAGLDTTFYRMDNGSLLFYNIDFENVIRIRERYLGNHERERNIVCSVLDHSWMDKIDFNPEKGIFILAGGLFMYFTKTQVKDLFITFAKRFSGGELIFDASSKLGKWITNLRVKKEGKESMKWHFYVKNSMNFSDWDSRIQLVEKFTFWEKTPIKPNWKKITKKLMKVSDFLKMGKFVHLKFEK